MKTIKFIFSLLVSLMLVVPALAAPTDGYVYSIDVSTKPGEEIDLPIALKSTENNIKSFQFNITLPDGLSFVSDSKKYMYNLVPDYSNWVVNHATETGAPSNTALVMVSNQADATTSIEKGDHVILYLRLKVDNNSDLSNTTIVLSKEVVTLEDGTETQPLANEETITSIVSEAPYAEGYSIDIVPFKTSASEEHTLVLNMTCATEDITDIEFDVVMPSILTRTKAGRGSKAPAFANQDRISTEDHSIAMDANGHVTIEPNTEEEYRMIAETSGSLVNLYYTTAASVTDGIYQLELTNIKMKQDDGTILYLAPYIADIFVGATTPVAAPDENGAVAFHGNYADETAQALMTEALKSDDITTIDLSEVTAATEIVPQNKNAIIRCTKDLGLTQDNVVIGDECANLVLTDGYAFRNTEAFTATTASYSRTMADHSWGTLCLPFAASSTNANVYTLNSVTTGTDGEMKFTQTVSAAVEANTPCVIKKDAEEVTFTATSVEVPVTPADCNVATDVDGWTLLGTTTDLNVADLSKAYFINGDHFWKAGTSLHVAPFRAYFEGASSAAKFRIAEETNGIETIENDAEAGVIYDLQGRAVKAAQAGQIYVQDAKKFVVK